MTLRQIRLSRGLTLETVASDLGIHTSTLCKYEKGDSRISPKMMERLKKYYGVDSFEETSNRYITLTNKINSLKEEIERLNNEVKIHKANAKALADENNKLIKKLNSIKKSIINKVENY